MIETKTYWFPAKRHGWGWGVPIVWQGWVVLSAFALLLLAGAVLLLPRRGPAAFFAYSVILCAALVAVCLVKGEPPSWRRGAK
jgi:hypothetical protein